MQGDTYVSDKPNEVLVTILGSCIAACIRDPHLGVGGMNHFLLPHGSDVGRDARCYGINAMELLINELLKSGARRERLQAKIFGGANVMAGLSDIGGRNAEFAEQYLRDEGIPLIGSCTGGTKARKIQFWPNSGRARQALVEDSIASIAARELKGQQKSQSTASGDVELF
ncbi:MAG: chemotaxis protein CheD [Rhizomicrobium sp.]